jgi:hypothetical protein
VISILTHDVQDVVLTLMEELSCPRSLTVAILLREGDVDQLVGLKADPQHYPDAHSYFRAVAATDLLRKYDGFRESLPAQRLRASRLESLTVEKWYWAEKECYRTNERLSPFLYGSGFSQGDHSTETLSRIIQDVRKAVISLIGYGPPKVPQGAFGPGATASDPSRSSTVLDKMSSCPTITPNALGYLLPWSATKWAGACSELGREIRLERFDTFFSVPKDATIRRGCAKVPSINGYYQLGLGRVLKRLLYKAGLDLWDGQTDHRRVACSASQSGEFATVDLSSASDTVSYNLVKLLLPPRWFRELDSLRSPFCKVEGKVVRLEKFSAMGNGYTFELETIIFASIIKALLGDECVFGKTVWVFGDDLIIPSSSAQLVLAALKWFGFTPNPKKTFFEGNFRESCGGDFYGGVSVRAHFLKGDPDEPQKLISLANGIRRISISHSESGNTRSPLLRAWFKCLDLLPRAIRVCRGPVALGDVVIHDDPERWCVRWRASGIRYIKCYRSTTRNHVRWEGYAYSVQFAAALYGVSLSRRGTQKVHRLGLDYDPRLLADRYSRVSHKVGWVPYS